MMNAPLASLLVRNPIHLSTLSPRPRLAPAEPRCNDSKVRARPSLKATVISEISGFLVQTWCFKACAKYSDFSRLRVQLSCKHYALRRL